MATMMLGQDMSIERAAHIHLIQEVFARSPLFRDAVVSAPVPTCDDRVALKETFGDGPVAFRVVSRSEGAAYAILHALADAMVEIDHLHGALAGGRGPDEWEVPIWPSRQARLSCGRAWTFNGR